MVHRIFSPILYFAFLLRPGNVDAQLEASVNSYNIGNIDRGIQSEFRIPFFNQTREILKCIPRNTGGDLSFQIDHKLKSHERGELTITLMNRDKRRVHESLLLYTNLQDEPIEVEFRAKITGWKRAKCPEFKKAKIRQRIGPEKKRGNTLNALRIYQTRDKNRLFSANPLVVPYCHVVILLDASVSMLSNRKLDLMKFQLSNLINEMRPNDYLSIVFYNNDAAVLIEKVKINEKQKLWEMIDHLEAQGFTNGKAGIETALQLSEKNAVSGLTNHVVLLTDGAFNIESDFDELDNYLKLKKREFDFHLSVISVKSGKISGHNMRNLARSGDGLFLCLDDGQSTSRKINKVLLGQFY